MNIEFESARKRDRRYRTGVSLHSHTNHSKERLSFVYQYAKDVPLLRTLVARAERQYRERHNGAALDLNRAWWTPPLAPRDAWKLETSHIEDRFGLKALVSLSDHDDIEAGMSLCVLSECRNTPVSVEWSVPYGNTFFHLGVHNLPSDLAREMMARFAAVTADPTPEGIASTLDWINEEPDTLVVFNHPCWDENRVGGAIHHDAVRSFIAAYGHWLHAVELNGLRPWAENREAVEFAGEIGRPIISGGDRHALEPNVILNLTNANSFAAFVDEIKNGVSRVFVTDQYHEPFKIRILQSIADVLHGRWTDRVFYLCDDGSVRSLTELFAKRKPTAVQIFTGGIHVLRHGVSILRPFTPRTVTT